MKPKRTIIVSGMIAADAWQGGATWAVLQYLLGLRRLGHDVFFVEPVAAKSLRARRASPSPLGGERAGVRGGCADERSVEISAPSGATTPHPQSLSPRRGEGGRRGTSLADSDNTRYFKSVCDTFDLCDTSALLLAGTHETFGLNYSELKRITARADLLLNISGLLADEHLISKIPVRVYLDLDPAFNQLWHAVQQIDMRFAGHTHHVTIGQNIGSNSRGSRREEAQTKIGNRQSAIGNQLEPPHVVSYNAGCPVPTCGLDWLKTWQPVVLEHWPVAHKIQHDALTTIANWRGYGSIDWNGVNYGQKVHSLRQFMELPTLTEEKFSLALAIHPDEKKDLAALKSNRWQLLDPARVADTPASYRAFVQGSKAEFGIAKSGYVHSRCGWFSDRSVCYLASGRPVLAQDCGFKHLLPVGEGLFAFATGDDVLSAIDSLNSDYIRHAGRAREIAVEFFDSDKVLTRLLDLLGL